MSNRSVTAIPGCIAGHAIHDAGTTGVTALLFPDGAVAGHAIVGQAPGSRELAALSPTHLTDQVHGLVFAGASVFGLAAVDGVVRFLAEQGAGLDTGHARVPIVPAAILYDLDHNRAHPTAELGYRAASAANDAPVKEGRVGAGAGAHAARVTGRAQPTGIGCWAETVRGFTVAALVAVNAVGCIRDPVDGAWLAGELAPGQAEFEALPLDETGGRHTTLAAVVTDAPLTRPQAIVIARMAAAGIARTHYPAMTPFDGDIVFALSPSRPGRSTLQSPNQVAELGHQASLTLARAITRSVKPRA